MTHQEKHLATAAESGFTTGQGKAPPAPHASGSAASGGSMSHQPKDYGPGLSVDHARILAESAMSPEVARERGYRTVTTKAELERLGFGRSQRRAPALLVPVHSVHGEVINYQIRPDEPRVTKDGKPLKYETVAGSRMALDVPPGARARIGDPSVPLYITEGARKADAAVSHGLCCIAVLGVWNWRGSNEDGGKTALPDWESVALNGRRVYLCFDSDVMEKKAVYLALSRLKSFLEGRGASVRVIYLPAEGSGAKVGLDDYFAAGHTVTELRALASDRLNPPPGADEDEGPYWADEQGIWWRRQMQDGPVSVPLTNFDARIVSDVARDDGAEVERVLAVEATLHGRPSSFTVPASTFPGMGWVIAKLGGSAIVYPGLAVKDQARAAIQMLSGDVPTVSVFTHTGWRKIAGEWVYLHAGGALGAGGAVDEVEVALDPPLDGYYLPDPPAGSELKDAVRASLGLLDLAPDTISVPLLAAIWRAVLGPCDFSLFLAGASGVFKSELAALAQRHFGAGMDRLHLPGNWSGTDNGIEGLAFLAKDTLLTIDDFVPTGTSRDADQLHRKAERVLRAQGNRSGRQRMRPDATLRAPRPPRGFMLATGEDVPRGYSLQARLLVLEVGAGAVDPDKLTICQAAAAAGLYSAAMAAFVCWLASRFEAVRVGLRSELEHLREHALGSGGHRRTPEIVANLAVGLRHFLLFAKDAGALSDAETDALWRRCWTAFGDAAAVQAGLRPATDPTIRFVDLLIAALASGRAHLANPSGGEPLNTPQAFGWERRHYGDNHDWSPRGQRIGWIDGEDVYLEPIAAWSAVKKMGLDSDDPLTFTNATLKKRIAEKGLLKSTDLETARETYFVRRTLEGKRHNVLHFDVGILSAKLADEPDPFAAMGPGGVPSLDPAAAGGPTTPEDPATDPTTETPRPEPESSDLVGLVGFSVKETDATENPTREGARDDSAHSDAAGGISLDDLLAAGR